MNGAGKTVFGGLIGLLAVGLAVLVYTLMRPTQAPAPLLDWQDSATVARGAAIYESECTACHGSLATAPPADAPPPSAPRHDETGHSWEHPDYVLFQLTKSGEVAELCLTGGDGGMPQFEEALNDRQIVDVLSYIKSTWPEPTRAHQETVNTLYSAQNAAVRDLILTAD